MPAQGSARVSGQAALSPRRVRPRRLWARLSARALPSGARRRRGRDVHGRRLLGQSRPGRLGRGAALARHGRELSGFEPATTNNRMELLAAIGALETLKRPMPVRLHTDSNYLRNGITTWLPAWKSHGWRTADKKPVKNQDLWQRARAALAPPRVEWRWVRATAAIRTTSAPTSSPGPRSAPGALARRRAPPKGSAQNRGRRCSSRPGSARPRPAAS